MSFLSHLIDDAVPGLFLLGILVGAALLWKRTKRVPALMQLIGIALVDLGWGFAKFQQLAVSAAGKSLPEALWSESLELPTIVVCGIGVILFVIAYIWHAATQRRI